MKAASSGFVWLVVLANAAACGKSNPAATCSGLPPPVTHSSYRLAYAQVGAEGANPFRIRETFSMMDAAASQGLALTVFDAGNVAATQASQLTSIIEDGYDAIFLSPVDETTAVPQILAARQACIPVFLLSGDVDHSQARPGTDFVTYIGEDPVQQGNQIANWLLANVSGALTVLELTGSSDASITVGRQQGFDSVMAQQNRVSIVSEVIDNFRRPQARATVTQAFQTNGSINVVYAHNDAMGLGALDSLSDPRNAGILNGRSVGKTITLASIDGTLDVINEIITGTYNVTLGSDPDLGSQALTAWQNYLQGQTVPPITSLTGTVIDSTNAATNVSGGY